MWYWLALWVTDFLVLSEMEINIYLKLKHLVGDLPLIFHINRYTLVHDVFPHCACAAVCPPFTPGAEQPLPLRHAPKTHEYRIPEPVHCAQGEPEHHQALPAYQLQPLLPGTRTSAIVASK